MNSHRVLALLIALLISAPSARPDAFLVTNTGLNTITKYDASGSGTPFTNTYIPGPSGIALDSSGNVYVATQRQTIERFAPDGLDLGVFAGAGLSDVMGLAFDRAGNLFAANFGTGTVEKFSADGVDLGVFATVAQPTGLAFDSAGNLCVASLENIIRRFAPDGAPLPAFASAALNRPQGLAFDSLGRLFVANNGSDAVEMFSPEGVDLGAADRPAASPTPAAVTRDVYLAFRLDGQPGTGTQRDPFDGSTQVKLDALFKSFFDARTTNVTFHLGPGTYEMKGSWDNEWGLLSGWHIKGAGRSATILRQVAGDLGINPGSNGALFEQIGANGDDMSVEDLTCDCAYNRSGPGGNNSRPHGNFSGIHLWGKNPLIRNVTVTGCGWRDNECFAILSSGDVAHLPDNALYENVEVSQGGTGIYATNLSGMAMLNLAAMGSNPAPVFAHNGRIINCTFNLPEAGNAGGMPEGYDSGVVTGCAYIGYWHGLFHDTFVSRNITIVGNSIKALYTDGAGILFNAGAGNLPCENISIIGNTITGIAFASVVRNSTILGNRIGLGPGNHAGYSVFLDTSSVENIRVAENTIDAGLTALSRNTRGCWFRGNRTPAGEEAVPDTANTDDETVEYGEVATGGGLSGPVGVAFDSQGSLHVVNSLSATIEKSSADASTQTVTTTGFNPAFIAMQNPPRLANISTRLNVSTGDNILAGGFIVVGAGTKKVLIRGLGPSLADAGVTGVLADPTLDLYDHTGAIVASNDNWKSQQRTEIAATGAAPTHDEEAAVVTELTAGAYTVIERGSGETAGVSLIEIYDLDHGFGPELANISTRGLVGAGGDVMIAGFIASSAVGGNSSFLMRALGPSLGAAGVAHPLLNPVLELHNSEGAVLAANDDWASTQATEIIASGLAPNDAREAALLTTLPPGAYTAIVRGRDGAGGVGLVEVYNLH